MIPYASDAQDARAPQTRGKAGVTVILADPKPMFRIGLRAMLESGGRLDTLEANDLSSLLEQCACSPRPAIALIDLDLPPTGGAAAVTHLRESATTPVVWSSRARLTPDVVYELVRCGAAGVLYKEMAAFGLIRSLEAVADGEAPFSRELVADLVRRIHSLNAPVASRPWLRTLSSREREVLALVAEGQTNKTIARSLSISEFTAKRHVQNVLNKLALHSRRDAADRFREIAGGSESWAFSGAGPRVE
jgi:DNA-binding NarL/FixJ family response regulator